MMTVEGDLRSLLQILSHALKTELITWHLIKLNYNKKRIQ